MQTHTESLSWGSSHITDYCIVVDPELQGCHYWVWWAFLMVLHIIVCDCGCVLHFNHIYHIKLDIHYNFRSVDRKSITTRTWQPVLILVSERNPKLIYRETRLRPIQFPSWDLILETTLCGSEWRETNNFLDPTWIVPWITHVCEFKR